VLARAGPTRRSIRYHAWVPDGTRPRNDLGLDPDKPTVALAVSGPCLARIVDVDADGRPRVVFAGLVGPPPVARILGTVASEQLEAARHEGRPILIAFLEGRADAPVIVSLASLADLPQAPPSPSEPELDELDELEVEVDGAAGVGVEGRQLIEAEHELVLRCGAAAITLRADGTVRVTGRDITSWARRRHRIRGGSVAIN
jgi:hypothetical protein